jgi:glycosyltransferase involved in cell wall biosynthesis
VFLTGFSACGLSFIDFCFINDGSTDSTESILKNLNASYVTHSANIGVSGGLLTGFKIAKLRDYDYVIQCDSDGQHPVSKIPELILTAEKEKSDLLIASRFLDGTKDESSTLLRRLGSFLIRLTLKVFSTKHTMTDPTSGFRIYSKSIFSILINEMPEEYPEPEILALLLLNKKKITEVPIIMSPRNDGKSSISGIRSIHFMMKVLSALIGLRLRNL